MTKRKRKPAKARKATQKRKANQKKTVSQLMTPSNGFNRDMQDALRDVVHYVSDNGTYALEVMNKLQANHKPFHELLNQRVVEASENGYEYRELTDLIHAVVEADTAVISCVASLQDLRTKYSDVLEEYAKLISLGPR